VAITSVFSKIFEKWHYMGMMNFLDRKKSTSKHQHGYVQGRSTQTAILDLTTTVHERLAENKEVVLLCLDLSKAFNCVETETLLLKLNKYGFRGKLVNWIETFLKNRQQFVEIRGPDKCV